MEIRLDIIAFLEARLKEQVGNERNTKSLQNSIRKHLIAGLNNLHGIKLKKEHSPEFILEFETFNSKYHIVEVVKGNDGFECVEFVCKEDDFDGTFTKKALLDQNNDYRDEINNTKNPTTEELKEIYINLLKTHENLW